MDLKLKIMNIVMIIFAIIVVCVIAWCLYDDSKKKKNLSCFMEGGFTGDDSEEIKQFIRKWHDVRYVPVPVTAEDFQRLESKIDNLQKTIDEISNKNTHIV